MGLIPGRLTLAVRLSPCDFVPNENPQPACWVMGHDHALPAVQRLTSNPFDRQLPF